jgi:hypothetical protein
LGAPGIRLFRCYGCGFAGNEGETENSKCHGQQTDKKLGLPGFIALLQTFGNNQCQRVVLSVRQIGLEKIMTRSARIGLAAALLVGGATMAMAQNGPPTGGYPPARWTRIFTATMATIIATTPTILATTPSLATGTITALTGPAEVITRSQLVEH